MENKKLRVGIDVNEVLRARWLQFDRFFVQEFGEEGVPEQPYVFDLFGAYPWKDTVEIDKELKEPEDMPADINPLEYQVDEKTGEANADFALFKAPKKVHLTAKEVYNRFMYEDFTFELFGSASMMYKNMDLHVNEFNEKYKNTVEFVIFSKENQFSVPSTLFFLSKIRCRFINYRFVENNNEIWDNCDVFITTDPEFLTSTPEGKKVVKLKRPYNENLGNGSITPVLQLHDLFENQEFEKLINYTKPVIK